jgi:putative ABC transport system ATP-binding protein
VTAQAAPLARGAPEPLIELRGVYKTYLTGGHEVHALRGVDVAIRSGEFVSVMGPSGSGKTTLMEILGCLSRPTRGHIQLKGRAVDELPETELARVRGREIGFVFQAFNLLPRLSVEDNVALPLVYQKLGRRERRERAREALARVGLDHRATHRPNEISGGERQRAAIARALVVHPSILLGDEPTGNLDSKRGGEILDLLSGLHADGTTVVLVTHDATIGARAGRLIEISDGRIERDSGAAK